MRKDVHEIIDGNNDLIGGEDIPKTGSDVQTRVSGITDKNVNQSRQPFTYDMIGGLGYMMFPFFESEDENSGLLESIGGVIGEYNRKKIVEYFKNPNKLKLEYRNRVNESNISSDEMLLAGTVLEIIKEKYNNKLNEINSKQVVEEVVVDKRDDDVMNLKKDDNDILDVKAKKIVDVLSKIDTVILDKVINILGEVKNGK